MRYLILSRVNPLSEAHDELSTRLLIKQWESNVRKIGRDTSKRATWDIKPDDITNAALAHDFKSLLVEYDLSIFDMGEPTMNMTPETPEQITDTNWNTPDTNVEPPSTQWNASISKEDKLVKDPRSGAMKADGAKLRFDLMPPSFIEAVTEVLTFGAEKYADRNWEKGMSWGRPFAATMRHLWAWWRGEETDKDSGLSHLSHAACNLAFLIEYETTKREFDDRPYNQPETSSTD